jgi:hypothetical protein
MRLDSHSEMIALLAVIGKKRGYDIWIGRNEQARGAAGFAPVEKLRELVTTKAARLDGVTNLRAVQDMDLLWLKGGSVITAFEVECTTTMTSGLQRGSNLPANVPKVMVLPEEREADLERKMQSPLFRQHFEGESWRLLYFDAFREAYAKKREKTELEPLLGVKRPGKPKYPRHRPDPRQQTLMEFGGDENTRADGLTDDAMEEGAG